jgi:hypothetical protein
MLRDYRCHKVILIQPEERKRQKTDRRDAAALSELLWVNRQRLLAGKPVRGLRQVDISSTTDQENRRLTTLRKDASRARTRLINMIKHILRRHNLQWEMPTKTFPTMPAIAWLKKLVLPEIDQLEMNHLLIDLEHSQQRIEELEEKLAERCGMSEAATLLSTMPGVGYPGRTQPGPELQQPTVCGQCLLTFGRRQLDRNQQPADPAGTARGLVRWQCHQAPLPGWHEQLPADAWCRRDPSVLNLYGIREGEEKNIRPDE